MRVTRSLLVGFGISLLGCGGSQVSRPNTPPALSDDNIWRAALKGDVDAVSQHLAAGADIDGVARNGFFGAGSAPLHLAVLKDRRDVVKLLINEGADLNVKKKDETGGTALHMAASLGLVEIATALVEAGADINSTDKHGFTPLDETQWLAEAQWPRHDKQQARRRVAELLRKKGGRRAADLATEASSDL